MRYFDHNATSPLLARAREVWIEANEKYFGNASSPHRIGARADRALNDARERLAAFIGCRPEEIIWTSGATESNNTVLHHFAHNTSSEGEIWASSIEHPSVLAPATRRFGGRQWLIPTTREGSIDLGALRSNLGRARPRLIALMAVNNETGVLQPWRKALELCREFEVPFFCDAVQWVGKMPGQGLGDCDWLSASAHKFGGPKGVGFLKCPTPLRAEPLLYGGPQEEQRRAGTENVPGVLAMIAALEEREAALRRGQEKVRLAWREWFERKLLELVPGTDIAGRNQERIWNTVSAVMPETDCRQRWVVKLDKLGFAVSTGSACSSGEEKPSHVLSAMGYAPAPSSRVLRFSSGWETTESDWDALAGGLARAFTEFRNSAPLAPEPQPSS